MDELEKRMRYVGMDVHPAEGSADVLVGRA